MRVPGYVMGVKGDECQCGRRASIRHCISCGSTRTYARMNRPHRFRSGEVKFVDTEFRCQSCGHLFVEQEREFCEAPPVSQALAQQKLKAIHDATKTGEHLSSSDARLADALRDLLPSSGQDPKKAYDMLIYKLRVEFADRKAAGEDLGPYTMDTFVQFRLMELNVKPPVELESIDNTPIRDLPGSLPPDLADPQRDAIPVEERSIRLEWGRKKLAGRSVPDVEDYVKRRLAGELFE